MRVLLDHCTPKRFGRLLVGHDVRTARSMGWEDRDNGDLLKAAAASFDVLLTLDRGIQFQQHATSLPIAIIVMLAFNNRPETIAPFAPAVLKLLDERLERRVYIVDTRM